MKVLQVSGIIVHEDVITTKFACDYQVCKGRCCYINEPQATFEGCEITEEEAGIINRNIPMIEQILREHKQTMPDKLTYQDSKGNHYVSFDEKGRCCLNCDGGCVMRIADKQGFIPWGNPIACHLYPLVVTKVGRTHLRLGHYYDEWHLCDSAFERGEKEGIWLIDFCKDAIIRQFGEDFFNKLQKRADDYRSAHAK